MDFSGKGEFSYSSSSRTIHILVTAYADYGRWALNVGAKLSKEAESLKNTPIFSSRYGNKYIAKVRRMSAINVLITIDMVSNSLKRSLDSTVQGSLNSLEYYP